MICFEIRIVYICSKVVPFGRMKRQKNGCGACARVRPLSADDSSLINQSTDDDDDGLVYLFKFSFVYNDCWYIVKMDKRLLCTAARRRPLPTFICSLHWTTQ